MVDRGRPELSVRRQCALLGSARYGVYLHLRLPDVEEPTRSDARTFVRTSIWSGFRPLDLVHDTAMAIAAVDEVLVDEVPFAVRAG
jgi:hypothetical protein